MTRRIFPPPVREVSKGHGRSEIRTIQTSTIINDYLDFPYVAQVFKIERVTTNLKNEVTRKEVAYGITSLPPEKADPARLLKLVRGHWYIENGLHWVRDVTFDEDRSQVRTGAGPRALATLRNLAISLFRLHGYNNVARALRLNAWDAHRALALMNL